MIQLPRNLVHLFRSLLRKFVIGSFEPRQPLTLSAGQDGLRLRATLPDVLVEFFQAGDFGSGEVSLPADLLKQWDGARVENLTLIAATSKCGQAEWRIDGIPQNVGWEPPAATSVFPQLPTLRPLPANFLGALQQATACCSKDAVRFATNCILLDGTAKRIAATDGRQLLIHNGLEFPWEGEVMLPNLKLFGANDLSEHPLHAGKTDKHLTLRAGPWTLHFPLDASRRFPRMDQIVPKAEEQTTTLVLDKADGEFLVRSLPRLPGPEEARPSITLELGDEVVVRAKADKTAQATEIVLTRSRLEGKPLAVSLNRENLSSAIQLGLQRITLSTADRVVLAQDADQTYLFVPLPSSLIVPSESNARRICTSTAATVENSPANGKFVNGVHRNATHNGNGAFAASNGNGHASIANGNGHTSADAITPTSSPNANGHNRLVNVPTAEAKQSRKPSGNGWSALLEESVKLRDQARDLATGLGQFIRTVKQHRKQTRLVESTLSSLKQIKGLV